jgi:hypothetical protein
MQKEPQVGVERVESEGAEPEAEGAEPESAEPERVGPEHVESEHVEPDRVASSEYADPKRVDTDPKRVDTDPKRVDTDPKRVDTDPKRVDTDPKHIDPDHVNPKRAATSAPALQTPYMVMSVQANLTAMKLDIYAVIFSWLILAGYVVLPNTFTSLQNADSLAATVGGKAIQDAVRNVPLLPFAGVLCCIGAAGSCWLWWLQRRNYVWLVSHIFL